MIAQRGGLYGLKESSLYGLKGAACMVWMVACMAVMSARGAMCGGNGGPKRGCKEKARVCYNG